MPFGAVSRSFSPRTRRAVAALAVAAGGLIGCGVENEVPVAGSSDAAIEPKRGIAGVRLAMTAADVREVLGRPASRQASRLHGGWTEWRYRRPPMRVTFDDLGRAWDVRTEARAHRTREGVGVGSTEAELRRALPGLRCRPYGGPPRYRNRRSCTDGRGFGEPFTTFTVVDGRVESVTVARGLAL